MLVRDFKVKMKGVYDDGFLNTLPSTCFDPRCGSPTEMSDVLTGLHCNNPRCPSKIAIRIVAMMNKLGVKDFSGKGKRVDDFITKWGVDNPLSIFCYELSDGTLGDNISMDMSTKIFNQLDAKRAFTLAEYVRIANMPFIQTSAFKIFSDYDDLAEAYRDIEEGGVEFIRNKLNIGKGSGVSKEVEDSLIDSEDAIPDISVRALKIYQSLMTYKQDLFDVLPFVKIINTHAEGMVTLKVKCTEEVGKPYRTKAEFYSEVNNLYGNLHVEFVDNATKELDYLVWAGAEDDSVRVSRKVEKVTGWNEQYKKREAEGTLKSTDKYIPIVSATQLLKILEGLSSK